MHAKIALVTVDSEGVCVMREVLAAAGGALFLAGVFLAGTFLAGTAFFGGNCAGLGNLAGGGGRVHLVEE